MTDDAPAIVTRVALAAEGEHHFCGYRVLADLMHTESMAGMLWLACGGRRLGDEDRSVLESLFVATGVGDPRIWPLKVTRLAASYGSSVAGIAAGTGLLEESFIGPWSSGHAAELLRRLAEELGPELEDDEAVRARARELVRETRRLIGFGVPFRRTDERVEAIGQMLARRGGRHRRRYWKLMEQLADVVRAERDLEPNLGMAMAASLLDLGLDAGAISLFCVAISHHTFVANAFEGAAQRPAILRALGPEHVRYAGPAERLTPRAREAAGPAATSAFRSPRGERR